MTRLIWLVAVTVFGWGCSDSLPRYTKVEDLRVLAIKATPPEFLLDSPQSVDMQFDALVVDPRGGPLQFVWSFCPVESGRACMDFETFKDRADGFGRQLAEMRAIAYPGGDNPGDALPVDEVSPAAGPDWWEERGVWQYSIPSFQFTAPSDLYLYHLLESALGGGLGAWPSAILELTKGQETLLAQKRVSLGVADLRSIAEDLATSFGYVVCPEGQTPADLPGCILIRDRTPNLNPVFAAVEVAEGDSALAEFHEVDIGPDGDVAGLVSLPLGESIRIRPVFTEASFEPYQVIKGDLETLTLFVEDTQEDISVAWFCSAGSVQDELTWPKFTKTLDTVFTAPTSSDLADTRATVWMVARDERGGVQWMSVEVQLTL